LAVRAQLLTRWQASEPQDIEHALESVEWDTLLYFAALFVMVEGMATLGLIRAIGTALVAIVGSVPDENQEALATVLLIWVSALVSSVLDNTAYTATMVSVVITLADPLTENLGGQIELKPLAWALAFGACLGGNGTLIGSSANVVVSGIARIKGHPISFMQFTKIGFPTMLLSCLFATAWLLLRFESY
jgi:Na+/H+ antiporter NhaD/arsenite permease-like protein